MVRLCDARQTQRPLLSLQASTAGKAVTSIDFNPLLPNILLTASTDRSTRLFDLQGSDSSDLSGSASLVNAVCLGEKNMAVGNANDSLRADLFNFPDDVRVCSRNVKE